MTTELNKAVTRKVGLRIDNRIAATPFVVSIYPSGDIGIRESGRRKQNEIRVPLSSIYLLGVKAQVEADRKEKSAKKRTKRNARKRG